MEMIKELTENIGDILFMNISDAEVVCGTVKKDIKKAWELCNEALNELGLNKI